MKKVAIVGGGISGLVTAFFLVKKGFSVTIFEKSSSLGGKIATVSSEFGPMETAANGILADALVEHVFHEIGLDPISTLKASRNRYIFKKGKPLRWPINIFKSLGFIAFFLKKPWRDQKSMSGKTLSHWLKRYISKETIDYIITPACQGIFGKGADELSALLVMNYFFNKKKVARGKLKGTISARGGMGEIIEKLSTHLRAKGVVFETTEVTTLSEMLLQHNEVIVATGLPHAATLLDGIRDMRGKMLKKIPLVDVVSVNVFFKEKTSKYPGFGILFPRGEGIEALGVLQNSYIFENRSTQGVSETWIFNLTPSVTNALELLLADREKVFGHQGTLLHRRVNTWPQALPLYGLELESYLANTPPGHPRVHLIGNYLGQIGLNRIFHMAEELAETV